MEFGTSNLKGTAVVPVIQLFIKRYGVSAYKKLVASLSPNYQLLYIKHQDVMDGKLYPELSHIEMLEHIGKHYYPDRHPDDWLFDYMYAQMDYGMNQFYRIVIKLITLKTSPRFFATKSMKFWRRYHDTGNLYVVSGSNNDLVAELHDFIGHNYEVSRSAIMNATKSVLILSGAKNVTHKIKHFPNKATVEFSFFWD